MHFFPEISFKMRLSNIETRRLAEGVAIGETRVLDLMAQGYNYEQIKKILKSGE